LALVLHDELDLPVVLFVAELALKLGVDALSSCRCHLLVEVLLSLGTVGRRVEEEKSFDLDVPRKVDSSKRGDDLLAVGGRKLVRDELGDSTFHMTDSTRGIVDAAAVEAVAGVVSRPRVRKVRVEGIEIQVLPS